MTNTVPVRSPQTDALIDWLVTDTELLVGDGKKPDGGGWQGAAGQSAFVPYLVLHPFPGGNLDGTLGDPWADADFLWQLNAHGANRAQCEQTQDRARTSLLTGPYSQIVIAGRSIKWIRCEIPAGAARQDPDQPAVWWSFEQYRIGTTPTAP